MYVACGIWAFFLFVVLRSYDVPWLWALLPFITILVLLGMLKESAKMQDEAEDAARARRVRNQAVNLPSARPREPRAPEPGRPTS